jgi:AraC family transcriptional regulator of adaptative response/methylated-DNA-[protein]-cysteine methyltransferase
MRDVSGLAGDYRRVEKAILYVERNYRRRPSLEEIARAAGMSGFHFQKLFSHWAGISPKRFMQYLTKEHAKRLLEDSRDVLDAAYGAGLSGPGRLHDLMVSCEAVTPGEYGSGGEGLSIAYGFHPSPFGECMIAATERGICALHFMGEKDAAALVKELKSDWPKAEVRRDQEATGWLAAAVFSFPPERPPVPLHLHVKGTNFQIKVWEALLRIPPGSAVCYEDIARYIGSPGASRAVGSAVAANPVPYLIPCHRVIRSTGEFGNYSEGPARKKAILGWEAATGGR